MTTIDNSQDTLDVRDIIARVEYLRDELTDVKDGQSEGDEEMDLGDWLDQVRNDPDHVFIGAVTELEELETLLEDLAGNGGDEQWEGVWYPVTLIRESHFTVYAQELAEDTGLMNDTRDWPFNCIDWEQAARELKMDYTCTEFDGVTYFFR